MALLAETVVEEWLMRQGYFTIRGVRIGVQEMDILAVRNVGNKWENIHVEVQVSHNPVGYITGNNSAKKRNLKELNKTVDEWINKKFYLPQKEKIREKLSRGNEWEFMFVHGIPKSLEELNLIKKKGITIKPMAHVIKELLNEKYDYTTASASDLVDLIRIPQLTLENLEREVKKKFLNNA